MHSLILEELEIQLGRLQHDILEKGKPVLILFEGSSGRVIGRTINELIRCLEPRGVTYHHFDPKDIHGHRSIFNYLKRTPGKGQIALYDRSWYSAIIDRYSDTGKDRELDRMLEISNDFEKYLTDNGVLIIKILLKATASAVKEYSSQYGPDDRKGSFLSMDHIDPVKYREVMFDRVYSKTDTIGCPWNIIPVRDLNTTVEDAAERIKERIIQGLDSSPSSEPRPMSRNYPNPRTDSSLSRSHKDVSKLSDELARLQLKLSESDRSLVICFEGWDAAGKGSSIKHLCHALNPRGYRVAQTKAPTETEKDHTYLWRFCGPLPKKGHITIFDRTWYGRMMVEPVEGFCTQEEYARAPGEINSFERMMVDNKIILIKFWMDITPEEQLRRFEKRQNDPLKQWKLTPDDWRNRSKWKEYDEHINAMMETTNTEYAPWTVVESNDKKYARAKILNTVKERLEKEMKD
jgi:Uncharacterized conserved protein